MKLPIFSSRKQSATSANGSKSTLLNKSKLKLKSKQPKTKFEETSTCTGTATPSDDMDEPSTGPGASRRTNHKGTPNTTIPTCISLEGVTSSNSNTFLVDFTGNTEVVPGTVTKSLGTGTFRCALESECPHASNMNRISKLSSTFPFMDSSLESGTCPREEDDDHESDAFDSKNPLHAHNDHDHPATPTPTPTPTPLSTHTTDTEGGNSEDAEQIQRYEDALLLKEEYSSVTMAECRRFRNLRVLEKARVKMKNYEAWRKEYQLDDEGEVNLGSYSVHSINDYDEHNQPQLKSRVEPRRVHEETDDDTDIWNYAISKSLLAFPSVTLRKNTSVAPCDDERERMARRVPKFVRCQNDKTRTKGGKRTLHLMSSLIDDSIAPLPFYSLTLAIYLDALIDRNSMEDIVTLVDVRKGKGWYNPSPTTLLPFVKQIARHLENFPGRLDKCVVYPVPPAAKFLWTIAKACLPDKVADKVGLHWGPSSASSPLPKSLEDLLDKSVMDALEEVRCHESQIRTDHG